ALWFRGNDGQARDVAHVVSHSPYGLAWGYERAGPADTALSILADITEDPAPAEHWHQEFEREVVVRLGLNQPFELERSDVERWLAGRGVVVSAEWGLAGSPSAPVLSPLGDVEFPAPPSSGPTARQLAERSAAVDARQQVVDEREAALDARERGLDRRDLRAEAWESWLRLAPGVIEARWTLPAQPVKAQIEALLAPIQDDLPTVAKGINVEAQWAEGVTDGSITERSIWTPCSDCGEGLHTTPWTSGTPSRAAISIHA
ncbi:MAG: DUF6166 domain-containing protein, partial [Acidimicrobiales bacterium]